jgi:hypothetical protein
MPARRAGSRQLSARRAGVCFYVGQEMKNMARKKAALAAGERVFGSRKKAGSSRHLSVKYKKYFNHGNY